MGRALIMLSLLQLLVLLLISWLTPTTSTTSSPAMSKPGCNSKCGSVDIPYPFGNTPDCAFNQSFVVNCSQAYSPPKPYTNVLYEIYDVSLEGHVGIDGWMAWECYSSGAKSRWESGDTTLDVPFTFSESHNKFTAIGCDTVAFIKGSRGRDFTSGCISLCDSEDGVINGSCTGIGCCQTSIPKGLRSFELSLESKYNHTGIGSFNPCSYAFLVDTQKFNFSSEQLRRVDFDYEVKTSFPRVLDWALGDGTCAQARASADYACAGFSTCYDSLGGVGYLCRCLDGFQGNPYLPGGCHDIDECEDKSRCRSGTCKNYKGGFSCTCPSGTHGNYGQGGEGCVKDSKRLVLEVALGIPLGILFLLLSCSWVYWGFKKRRLIHLKEKFFKANGGLLLQQQLSGHKGSIFEVARIFTEEEIKRATDNYSDSRIIGRGGYGIVYKGILPNGGMVAIKKSKTLDEGVKKAEEFINEISILLQVNHRNVVKLLGCCLEVQVPLLVYEFVPNGTLFRHIHNEGRVSSLSWNSRLRIAAETAGALAYLHSSTYIPILHGDIKSDNILLDNNYMAKVSDFGTSKLVPSDYSQITTLVQGTLGYLDPEYLQTSQLTEKSDVYSFGVVLLELLTGRLPISFVGSQEERNLARCFISALKEDRLAEVLETRVVVEASMEEIEAVSNLARCCLELKGAVRPSMKEVTSELEWLMRRFGV